MKWVTNLLYRNKRLSIYLLGLLLALLLLSLPTAQKAFVCQVFQTACYRPFWSLAGMVDRFTDIYELNADLQSELVRLRLERVRFQETKMETEQFREMLDFLPKVDYDVIPAHVFAYDQGRRLSSLTIKASQPLEPFLSVVDRNGLVGKVSSATGRIATVSLLVGPNCRVAARDQQTRSLGIVKWHAGRGLIFDDVGLDNEVNIGDTLISSGLGGVFPEGIVIGVVTGVATGPADFFQRIRVRPAVDFGSLDNVMVLRSKGDQVAD